MTLRILTYNIHKGVGTDGVPDLARIADVVRHYRPDVLALQEVMWFDPRLDEPPQPRRLAELCGFEHGAVGLITRRRMGHYGNVTLSRFPIVEHATLDLTVPLKKPRGALHTRIAAPGGDLHVYNVHLGLAGFERTLQVERLLADADEVAPAPAPAIVLGDTNDWRDRVLPQFAARGFLTHAERRGTAHGTFPSWYPVGVLDRVFVRGGVRLTRVMASRMALARVASDHLPVVADAELAA